MTTSVLRFFGLLVSGVFHQRFCDRRRVFSLGLVLPLLLLLQWLFVPVVAERQSQCLCATGAVGLTRLDSSGRY